jgi:hypothetical protein
VRLAVALRLPADVTATLARLPRPPLPGVVRAVAEQWLVTLADELAGAGPVGCLLGPVTVRLGGQWLGVKVTGLDELAEPSSSRPSPWCR